MRKGKRKKPESRRRGSTPQQASSEATPQQANSEATPQQASSEAIPLHTSSESTSQQPSPGSTPQPSSESTPQPPAPQAVPAPETNPLTRSLVPQDTNTKASSRSRKTGGQTSNSRTSGLPADGPPGSPRSRVISGSSPWLACILERCLLTCDGLGVCFYPGDQDSWALPFLTTLRPNEEGSCTYILTFHLAQW